MKVAIAGDHYAVELIDTITKLLKKRQINTENLGAKSKDQQVRLQDIILEVTTKIKNQEAEWGILVCGTGVGVEIGANKVKKIRASLCRDAEQAKNARIYDNANVLCLGSWYHDDFENIIEAWLSNEFDGDTNRAQMLKDFDRLNYLEPKTSR